MTTKKELENNLTLDSSKEWTLDYLKTKAIRIAEQVADGYYPPVEAYALVRSIQEVCNQILKIESFMRPVRDRLEDLNPKERHAFGVEFEVRNGRAKWDYSSDPHWVELTADINSLIAERKMIEKTLQTAFKCHRSTITEDGEVSDSKLIECIPGRKIVAAKFKKN